MREVVLYMSVSVNGLVASDREHPGVAIAVADVKQWKLEQISSAGAHLMGHTTYAEKSGYWPGSDDAYATPMNDIPKIVFSTTLDDDEATWRVTRVARGDLAAEIADIKTEPFVVVWGGAPRRRCAGRARPDRRVPPARPTDGAGQRSGPVRHGAERSPSGPGRVGAHPQRHRAADLPTRAVLTRG